jgi:hypothetical protein
VSEAVSPFDAGARETLAALADILIPAGEGMPSAGQAGAAGRWLDATLEARPDLGPPLSSLLDRWRGSNPGLAIAQIKADDPAGYDVLTTVVTGAYFLNPEVRGLIGYPGQRAVPIPEDGAPDYEADGLLASVVARGPIYRPTPDKAPGGRAAGEPS